MLRKIIQNGLPPSALLFFRMNRLGVKSDVHQNAVRIFDELDGCFSFTEGVLNQLLGYEFCVFTREVKTGRAIFSFHA